MTNWPLIEEVVNHPVPGEEQYHSYEGNIEYKLFNSNGRYIYVKMDHSDMNVYVTTKDKILLDYECQFLKSYFNNFDFVLSDCENNYAHNLEMPMLCHTNTDLLKYTRVL